jgi:RNA polymerase sigma-70 factor (sigma-E family)
LVDDSVGAGAEEGLSGQPGAPGPLDASDGFVQLYRDRYEGLVRLAVLLVDSTEQAEELVQEAFARAYLRWDKLDHPEAYVRRALVNASRDVLRRRRVERRLSLRRTPPDDTGPEHDYLDDALATLPGRERIALVLTYYEGLDEAATAGLMGCPRGTVKSLLHRGIARLRGQIHR